MKKLTLTLISLLALTLTGCFYYQPKEKKDNESKRHP